MLPLPFPRLLSANYTRRYCVRVEPLLLLLPTTATPATLATPSSSALVNCNCGCSYCRPSCSLQFLARNDTCKTLQTALQYKVLRPTVKDGVASFCLTLMSTLFFLARACHELPAWGYKCCYRGTHMGSVRISERLFFPLAWLGNQCPLARCDMTGSIQRLRIMRSYCQFMKCLPLCPYRSHHVLTCGDSGVCNLHFITL